MDDCYSFFYNYTCKDKLFVYSSHDKKFNKMKQLEKNEIITKKHIRELIIAIVILYGSVAYIIFSFCLPDELKQKQEQARQVIIENKVKQHEKTLPHYKEYLQTKQQIAHYRDSLQRTMR